MKKILLALCVWAFLGAVALGQTLPSPTMNNLTVNGTTTLSNPLGINSGGTGVAGSPTIGSDVRLNGAPVDGVTDAGPAINSCLAANTVCVIPPTTNGLFVKTPIVVPAGKWLIGTVASGQNTSTGFQFPGVSWLICSSTISGACVTWGTANSLSSGGIKNLTVSRQAGTPSAGQKGIVFAGGYNVRMENVSVINFDTCFEFDQGISGQGLNNYAQMCASHYWVFNTWPEFSQVGGRAGANGSGNYNTALDDIYFTSSLGSGGTGPNSIDFVNYKFENDHTSCAFRWGNYTVSPGAADNYRFVNVYKEPMPAGSIFCSDSTVPSITGLTLQNSYISQDSGSADLFSGLNSATELIRWNIVGNQIYLSSATASPTSTGTYGFLDFNLFGNWMPPTTLTPGGGGVRNDKLTSIGNFYNGTSGAGLTINQGAYGWQQLTSQDQGNGGIVNNSDGVNQIISWPSSGVGTTISAPVTLGSTTTMKGGASISYSGPTSLTINDTSGTNSASINFQSNSVNSWGIQKSGAGNFLVQRYVSGTFVDNPILVTGSNGIVSFADGFLVPITVTASLPACSSTTRGLVMGVGDASSPTYNGTLTGGGSTTVPVFCNGSAWTTH